MSDRKLVKRHQKVAFYGVPASGSSGAQEFTRMTGFTDMSTSKNPKEYSRQYVDEAFEQSDVTGYSPSISYGFDQYKGDAVHDDIVKISDGELTGDDAVRDIVLVDFSDTSTAGTECRAYKRRFAVIPDSEGDGTDAYTYSGSFKTKGASVKGYVTIAEGNDITGVKTVEFKEGEFPSAQ